MRIKKYIVNALLTDKLLSNIRSKMFQTLFILFLNVKFLHMKVTIIILLPIAKEE